MRIEQIMRHDPTRVGPDETVENLIGWYSNPGNRSRYSYVVDGRGTLLGVVTMMELLNLFLPPDLVAEHEDGRLDENRAVDRLMANLQSGRATPVRKIMRQDLPTVRPGDFFLSARLLLKERKITALPVVDSSGALVGEVTRRTLLRLLDMALREPALFSLKKDSKSLFGSASEFFIG